MRQGLEIVGQCIRTAGLVAGRDEWGIDLLIPRKVRGSPFVSTAGRPLFSSAEPPRGNRAPTPGREQVVVRGDGPAVLLREVSVGWWKGDRYILRPSRLVTETDLERESKAREGRGGRSLLEEGPCSSGERPPRRLPRPPREEPPSLRELEAPIGAELLQVQRATCDLERSLKSKRERRQETSGQVRSQGEVARKSRLCRSPPVAKAAAPVPRADRDRAPDCGLAGRWSSGRKA